MMLLILQLGRLGTGGRGPGEHSFQAEGRDKGQTRLRVRSSSARTEDVSPRYLRTNRELREKQDLTLHGSKSAYGIEYFLQ